MLTLNKGEYTGDIVSDFTIDKSIITNTVYSIEKSNPNWHSHENIHLSFVFQKGKAETRRNLLYTEKGGSVFFYHSGQQHRWITPSVVSKSINIEIENDFLIKYNLTEDEIRESIENNVDTKALILKIQREMQVNDTSSSAAIQTLLLELVNYSKTTINTERPLWVNTLQDLLNDNWDKQLQLTEMAEVVGVHPVTISKYFRRYFSCTLGDYQRKLKVNRSIDLIKNSKLSLSEIAYTCGFADQSHFIRNFKQNTYFLPKDFQRL